MRITTVFAFMLSLFLVGRANAAPWDSKGWVKLGERSVNGRVDRDSITVGEYKGKFTKLTLVVEQSELELLDFEITFGNGEKFNPKVTHYFRENTRTRVIDLPGDERMIRKIDLKYRNIRGGGDAKVEVWAWKAADTVPWKWDPNGWQLLGQREVNRGLDHDRITVGRYKGKFEKLALVVLDSDLELIDFDVKFAKGPAWNPGLKHTFKEGDRSRIIDFPGDERTLKYIDMKYVNLPGGGRAKIQVWGK